MPRLLACGGRARARAGGHAPDAGMRSDKGCGPRGAGAQLRSNERAISQSVTADSKAIASCRPLLT